MPVDPFIEPLLAALPPLPDPIDDFDQWRTEGHAQSDAMAAQVAEPGPEVKSVRVVSIDVEGGSIDLRIYQPDMEEPAPAHVFLHGGGWTAGTVHGAFTDIACRERCVAASSVVVAVNYRKAPEHPFPTPLDDVQAALVWVVANAEELGIRTDLITVGGQSAGANLAAALALKVRDEGGPELAFLLLEAPALDLTLRQRSHVTYGAGYGLTSADIKRVVALYVPDPGALTNPYISPMLAADLTGLPPVYVLSAEYDPVRDDGERFVERLHEAGVPATFSLQQGHIHGSSAFTKVMESARTWRSEALDALRASVRIAEPSGGPDNS